MPFLICDLDKTLFITKDDKANNPIHNFHELSKEITVHTEDTEGLLYESKAYVINPTELAELINISCTEYDGIIFLTSGFWSENIINAIDDVLEISDKARDKFYTSKFYSATSEAVLFDENPKKIRKMDKNTRLKRIIAETPDLQGKHFVMLDDTQRQIASFKDNPQVTAILATTNIADKTFYKQALAALAEEQEKENIANILLTLKRPASVGEQSEAVSPLIQGSIFEPSKRILQEAQLANDSESTANSYLVG